MSECLSVCLSVQGALGLVQPCPKILCCPRSCSVCLTGARARAGSSSGFAVVQGLLWHRARPPAREEPLQGAGLGANSSELCFPPTSHRRSLCTDPRAAPCPPPPAGRSLPSPRQAAALCERAQQHLSRLESHKGTPPVHVTPFPADQRSIPKAFLIAPGEIEALGHLSQPGSGAPVPLAPGAASPC